MSPRCRPNATAPTAKIAPNSSILHDDRNMIVHVLADVSQKARSDNADGAERNAHVVDILVRLSVRDPACRNHQFVCTRDTADARDGVKLFQERCTGQLNGFFNQQWVGDVEFCHHGAADVLDSCFFELGDEDIVATEKCQWSVSAGWMGAKTYYTQ